MMRQSVAICPLSGKEDSPLGERSPEDPVHLKGGGTGSAVFGGACPQQYVDGPSGELQIAAEIFMNNPGTPLALCSSSRYKIPHGSYR